MRYLGFLATLLLALLVACSNQTPTTPSAVADAQRSAPNDGGDGWVDPQIVQVPEPTLEANQPITDTATIYCVEFNSFDDQGSHVPGDRLLTSLIAVGFLPVEAWIPSGPSPCDAIGAVSVAYVRLAGVDDRIVDHGFRAEPASWWSINCGVPGLWHYVFP